MSGEINYAEWFDRVDARVRVLEDELAKLKPVRDSLAPLAGRGDPARLVIEGTPSTQPDPPPPPAPTPPTPTAGAAESPGKEGGQMYRGKVSLDAAIHFLCHAGRSATGDVAEGLRAGGYESKSPQFVNNVYTTLRRAEDRGFVARVGEATPGLPAEWELTEAGRAEAEKLVAEWGNETAEGAPTPSAVSEDPTGHEASGDSPRLALTP